MLNHDLTVIAPQLVLAVSAMAGLLWGAWSRRDVSAPILWIAVVLLVALASGSGCGRRGRSWRSAA